MQQALAEADIRSADGHVAAALCAAARNGAPSDSSPVLGDGVDAPVLLLTPAMGVPHTYYRRVASALSARGYHVVLPGQRGSAASSTPVARGVDFGYRELLDYDWPAAIEFARRRFGAGPLVLVGHSLGGQLNCLHQSRVSGTERAAAMVMLACCSAHGGGHGRFRGAFAMGGAQLAAAIARGIGHFPGHRLGFGGHQPKGVIRDWARDARLGRYELRGDPRDYRALLAAVHTPTLAVSFAGDTFAPARAVDAMCARLAPGSAERVHLGAAELGLSSVDHFRWVRAPGRIADCVDAWLRPLLRAHPGQARP